MGPDESYQNHLDSLPSREKLILDNKLDKEG